MAQIGKALRVSAILSVVVWLLAPLAIEADTVYDNYFGQAVWGQYYPPGNDIQVVGRIVNALLEQAMKFPVPPDTSYLLESATFPIYLYCGVNGGACPASTAFYVEVFEDADGLPGVLLESMSADQPGPIPVWGDGPHRITATFAGSLVLASGELYWLVLRGIGDSRHVWTTATICCDMSMWGPGASRYNGTWALHSGEPSWPLAFRIEGSPAVTTPVETATWGKVKALYQ